MSEAMISEQTIDEQCVSPGKNKLNEAIDSVKESQDVLRENRETTINFTKVDDRLTFFTEERGLMRRTLAHPSATEIECRVEKPDGEIEYIHPEGYDGGAITSVKAKLPVSAVKVMLEPRKDDRHSLVISDGVI